MLSRFRECYPDVQLYLQEMNPDWLVAELHEGRIDVSFFYLPFQDGALARKPISREPLAVALPETHEMASEKEVDLCDLALQVSKAKSPERFSKQSARAFLACMVTKRLLFGLLPGLLLSLLLGTRNLAVVTYAGRGILSGNVVLARHLS